MADQHFDEIALILILNAHPFNHFLYHRLYLLHNIGVCLYLILLLTLPLFLITNLLQN